MRWRWESSEPSAGADRKSSSLGQAWEGPARPLGPSPSSFLGLSGACQPLPSLAPSHSEALGLFGETPPPTLPLPGNSCGWMSGWEPSRGGGLRPKEGEREGRRGVRVCPGGSGGLTVEAGGAGPTSRAGSGVSPSFPRCEVEKESPPHAPSPTSSRPGSGPARGGARVRGGTKQRRAGGVCARDARRRDAWAGE